MNEWLLIGLMALVTYVPRYLPMAIAGKVSLTPALARALDFVPVAVLTAIIAQTAFVREGEIAVHWENPHAMATLIAFFVGVVWRNLLLTIVCGLVAFMLFRVLL